MKKKVLASLLSLCLLIGLMPSAAFAGSEHYHSEKAIAKTDAADSATIISTDTVWDKEQALSGDLIVKNGITLTINAPVTISETVTISGGGTIKRGTDCTTDLITVSEGSTLTCRDITIDGGAVWADAKSKNTGIVAEGALILSNGTFFMEDGAVLQNNDYRTPEKESGTLHLVEGTAEISGGTIRCNYGGLYGAGIVVGKEAELTFSDGTVSKNHSTDGGGIFVWGKAEISGGEIYGNSTDSIGGGIRIATGGKIEMTGGKIFENEAVSGGGGIHVFGRGSIFTMSGGEIHNNTVIGNGTPGTTELQGGGGIATINGGNVILSGNGNIHHNDAGRGNGGGIRIGSGGSIEMTGGIISHNTSTNTGSGLYTWSSSVELNGGTIKNNTATITGDTLAGGGVSLHGITNTVSIGDITITENLAKKGDAVFPEYDLVFQLLDYNKLTLSKTKATGTPCSFCVLDYDDKGQYGKPENFSFSTPENFSVDVLKDLRYKSVSVEEIFQPWYDSNAQKIYLAKVVTNGGAFTEDTTYENDKLSSPSRDNYTFEGWYTDDTLTTPAESYQQGGTYYAKWLSLITLNANGGTFTDGTNYQNVEFAEGQPYGKLPEPTREEYVFDGWYADEDLTQKVTENDTPAGNTTLYAKWEKKIETNLYFVSPHIEDQTYTGEEITPNIEVYKNDQPMDAEGYTVKYEKNTNAGTATAKVFVDNIEIGTATFTIKKAPLTVTAKDVEIPVGGELPKEYSYSISGWKGSDTDSLLTGVSAVCENADSNTAGEYPITVSGPEEIDNYKIAYVNGMLTVSEKSSGGIIIPPSGDQVTYNPSSDTTTADIHVSVGADGTARVTVSEALADKIVTNAVRNQSKEVVLDVATYGSRAKAAEVKLPAEAIKELLSETDAKLTVKTDAATLHLDRKAMEKVAEKAAAAGSVTFSIGKEKEESNALYLDLHIAAEQGEITNFGSGAAEITVKLPYALCNKEVTAVYIDDKGIYEKIGGVKHKDNTFTFTTNHFSSYAVMETAEADKIIKEQTDEKNERLIKGVENTTIKLSYKKNEIGKGWIKLRYKKSSGYKVDNYEIFRSAKKKTNFGKKAWFVTRTNKTSGYYKNGKSVKKGTRYYYKMRGVREIAGKTYYTKWSNTVMRTGR